MCLISSLSAILACVATYTYDFPAYNIESSTAPPTVPTTTTTTTTTTTSTTTTTTTTLREPVTLGEDTSLSFLGLSVHLSICLSAPLHILEVTFQLIV